ncbi:hypothetical protein [Phaffia rhodozyma]|uniref:Uncharacterized protein n=1 Tax=Phaffia rhodozyma TaxID=264483 RepID=A0A0F7SRU8_PHARH|nr:hypothetical protein [Phaffia rhodozyma]
MVFAPLIGAAAIAFAGLSANALPLSLNCTQSLALAISADPESTCFATPALEVFLPTLIGSTNTSIAAPLATYLEAVCPAPLCTDEQIEQTFATIGAGCSDLFAELGVSPTVLGGIVPLLPTVKEYVCLEATYDDPSDDTPPEFCVVDIINSTETLIGANLTVDLVLGLVINNGSIADIIPNRTTAELQALAPQVCTDCLKTYYFAAVNSAEETDFEATDGNTTIGYLFTEATMFLSEICGPDFFDANIPVLVYNGTTYNTIFD